MPTSFNTLRRDGRGSDGIDSEFMISLSGVRTGATIWVAVAECVCLRTFALCEGVEAVCLFSESVGYVGSGHHTSLR